MEAKEEMEDAAKRCAVEIPSFIDVKKELKNAPDIPIISSRIKDVLYILKDFR